jgi:hypothetical protein
MTGPTIYDELVFTRANGHPGFRKVIGQTTSLAEVPSCEDNGASVALQSKLTSTSRKGLPF